MAAVSGEDGDESWRVDQQRLGFCFGTCHFLSLSPSFIHPSPRPRRHCSSSSSSPSASSTSSSSSRLFTARSSGFTLSSGVGLLSPSESSSAVRSPQCHDPRVNVAAAGEAACATSRDGVCAFVCLCVRQMRSRVEVTDDWSRDESSRSP